MRWTRAHRSVERTSARETIQVRPAQRLRARQRRRVLFESAQRGRRHQRQTDARRVVDSKTAPAATGAEKGDETLKAILEEIAPDGEVLAAVSNKALINEKGDYGMLRTWLDGVQRSKVKNYLVICLDETVAGTMKKLGVPYWHRERKALADGDETNHGISAQSSTSSASFRARVLRAPVRRGHRDAGQPV